MKTMRVFLPLAALAVILLVVAGVEAPASGDGVAEGKAIFEAQKCSMCHSVAAIGVEAKMKVEKMRGPDLGKSAAERDAAWLAKFLKKEIDIDGKKHKKEFKGTDADLDALVTWIESLPEG